MRSRNLAIWLIPGLLRRYALALIAATLGLALFGALTPLVAESAGSAGSSSDGLGSPALRAINVSGYAGVDAAAAAPELTIAAVDALADVEGVERAEGWTEALVSVEVGDDGYRPASFIPRIDGIQPGLVEGVDPTGDFEVLVSSAWARDEGVALGDLLRMQHPRLVSEGVQEGVDSEVTVSGFYDGDVTGVDPPGAVYGTRDTALELKALETGLDQTAMSQDFAYPTAYVFAASVDELAAVSNRLQEAGYPAASVGSLLTQVPALQRFLEAMRPILAVLLGVFLVVIAWSTSSSLVASRRSEVGLLRALGWSRGEVQQTFTLQFAVIGAFVGVAGAVVALLLLLAAGPLLADVEPFGLPLRVSVDGSTYLQLAVVAVSPALLFALASALPVARLARVPADDVLRELRGS